MKLNKLDLSAKQKPSSVLFLSQFHTEKCNLVKIQENYTTLVCQILRWEIGVGKSFKMFSLINNSRGLLVEFQVTSRKI